MITKRIILPLKIIFTLTIAIALLHGSQYSLLISNSVLKTEVITEMIRLSFCAVWVISLDKISKKTKQIKS